MNVDLYLARKRDPDTYNCLHLTRDAWLELTGRDIRQALEGLLGPRSERHLQRGHFRAFRRIPVPRSPCIVYMRQAGTNAHVGVFFEDRLLHMNTTGPEFLPLALAARGFNQFRFYQ